jgi:hypothetical protein
MRLSRQILRCRIQVLHGCAARPATVPFGTGHAGEAPTRDLSTAGRECRIQFRVLFLFVGGNS